MTDFLLNFVHQSRRFFNSQARPPADVQAELTGIYVGKEIPPQKEVQTAGKQAKT